MRYKQHAPVFISVSNQPLTDMADTLTPIKSQRLK